jgi:hypothetical protein
MRCWDTELDLTLADWSCQMTEVTMQHFYFFFKQHMEIQNFLKEQKGQTPTGYIYFTKQEVKKIQENSKDLD